MTRFDSDILRVLIARAIENEGLRPLSRRLGVSIGALRSIRDRRDYQVSSLVRVSDALGFDLYFGRQNDQQTIATTLIGDKEFTALELQNIEASAGPGHMNDDNTAIGALAFRNEWLAKMSITPSLASLIRVRGDSMEPTLLDGTVVLIDHQRNEIRNHSVYALNDLDGSTRIKRIELIPSKAIILRSDNPTFDTEVRINSDMNNLQIIGEVVWSARVWD